MELAVVDAAKRDREFIRHFATQCPFLSKSDVMRVRRPPATHRARLSGHEADVILAAIAARLHQCEGADASEGDFCLPFGGSSVGGPGSAGG